MGFAPARVVTVESSAKHLRLGFGVVQRLGQGCSDNRQGLQLGRGPLDCTSSSGRRRGVPALDIVLKVLDVLLRLGEGAHDRLILRFRFKFHFLLSTLEVTQGQIVSQSPTDATRY